MKRKLSPWLLSPIANTLIGSLGLLTSIIVARSLGPILRGSVAEAMLWPTLVLSFGGIVNTQTVVFFWSKAKNDNTTQQVIGTSLFWVSLLSFFLIIFAWMINFVILKGRDSYLAGNIYALIIPGILLSYCFNSIFLAEQRPEIFWGLRLSNSILYVIGLLVLTTSHRITPISICATLVISNTLPVFVSIFLFYRLFRVRPKWQIQNVKNFANYGFKTNLTGLPSQLNMRADQALMSLMLPVQTLGLYSIAFSWSSSLYFIGSGLSMVMLTRSASVDHHNEEQIKVLFQQFRMVIIVMLGLGLIFTTTTPVILPLLFGEAFRSSILPAIILCFASIVLCLNINLHELIRGLGFPEIGIWAEVISFIFNIGMLFIILPLWAGVGAAIASLISYLGVFIILSTLLSRQIKFPLLKIILPKRMDVLGLYDFLVKLIKNGIISLRLKFFAN